MAYAGGCSQLAIWVKEAFNSDFWYEEGGYLYDVVGDDFISAKLNLQNLNGPTVYFTNSEDFGLASYKDNTHNELYDYISFYNDEVMKKTEVSIDDLDPTIQFFVRNYNGLKKEKKLVK